MNAHEIARRRAAQLHADAVACGHDPSAPYAFACAEAARREIEVERLPPGDTRLHGGRAVYDPDALLILHEDSGDTFLDAFLVAHELGHVELEGRNEPSLTLAIDPYRGAENCPVGIDRVVDYSRRQRREIQMDLFAREFLLPRSCLRALHLADGASASDIAARFGAPLAVVAQQLLDALLLPEIPAQPDADAQTRPLLPDQARAAAHDGAPYLLEAGPGTGKTQTLVGRVAHLLGRGVEAEKILILTFSNKAAAELADRIASRHPDAAAKIWSGTFHSFGLDIIRRFHELLDLPPDPPLIDRCDAIAFLENEYTSLELEHFKNLWDPADVFGEILAAISRAQDEVADAAAYRSHAQAMLAAASGDDERVAAERCLEVATVYEAYERHKRETRRIDLGDMVSMPVRLCERHPHVQKLLAGLYQHILVDEYQDVNRSSVRLLRALAGDGRNLWVVGDAKQSIYRFRGASAYNMTRFDREDFPGGTRGRLTTNFRSHQEIVDAYLTFAAEIPSVRGTDISLVAHRGTSGHLPTYQSVDTDDQEVAAVAESIEQLRALNYSYRDQAVLSAGNERLERLAEGLERLGIPVLYLGSLFERDEIKNLLSLLSLLVDGRAMGLVRVAAMDAFAVPLADVALLIAHLKALDAAPLHWMSAVATLDGVSPEGRTALLRIVALLNGYGQRARPWDVLTSVLLDRSRLAAALAQAPGARGRAQGIAVWQFMNFLRAQPPGAGLPVTRLLDRVRRLVRHADERELRQLPASAQAIDAVRLMTIHGSKGLEFPVVHIPGLTAASLPRPSTAAITRATILPPDGLIEGAGGKSLDAMRAAHSEEQECLFFVALSRARDRIRLYSPLRTSNGSKRTHSPFIDRLGAHLAKRHQLPTLALPPDPVDAPVPLTVDGTVAVTDHQLGLFQRCPRRFLYTHVLEVGGRQTETAFERLHVAVRKVVEAAGARPGPGLTFPELEAELNAMWAAHGPADHGYADEYKGIACELLRYLAEATLGLVTAVTPKLRLAVPGGEITVTPDQVLANADGSVTMRRIKTGHNFGKEEDKLAAAALRLAATAHAQNCSVEFVHLGDAKVTPVKMSPAVLKNRGSSIEEMVEAVRGGQFALKVTDTCPRCPAFFICGPVPAGPLTKKFSA